MLNVTSHKTQASITFPCYLGQWRAASLVTDRLPHYYPYFQSHCTDHSTPQASFLTLHYISNFSLPPMARLINVVFASVERQNGFGITERTEVGFHPGKKKKKNQLPFTGNKCKIVIGGKNSHKTVSTQ